MIALGLRALFDLIRRRAVWPVVILLAGCVAQTGPGPPLNSERIAQRFGSFGIDVLHQDDALRISNLYSLEGGRKICRTLALVEFAPQLPASLAAEHRLVLGGQSLGAVFKAHGWAIEKRKLFLGEIRMEPEFDYLRRWMGDFTGSLLAAHGYVFSVRRSGSSFDYATITEIHHPGYLSLAELTAIYGDATSSEEARALLRRLRAPLTVGPTDGGVRVSADHRVSRLPAVDPASREPVREPH